MMNLPTTITLEPTKNDANLELAVKRPLCVDG
jgi:hypothetical protein